MPSFLRSSALAGEDLGEGTAGRLVLPLGEAWGLPKAAPSEAVPAILGSDSGVPLGLCFEGLCLKRTSLKLAPERQPMRRMFEFDEYVV